MTDTSTKQTTNVAGSKRRSLSGQGGGLLNRMFGSSNGNNSSKEQQVNNSQNGTANNVGGDGNADSGSPQSPRNSNNVDTIQEGNDEASDLRSPTRKGDDQTEKKRRSSGVGRARELLSSAKQSLSNLGSSSEQRQSSPHLTPMQKLGKQDPALSVPTGSLNNSAGESAPGPRSTFRVGVTEDKNKKCRRTMEDTHAYLYNFLSTPAPSLGSDTGSQKNSSLAQSQSRDSNVSNNSSQSIVETDNGYFAIFDGHAGTFAAEWCGKKVHVLLEDIIRKNPNTPIPELLDMTFTTVDQQLEKLPLKNSGCTAVIAVLRWEDRVPNSQSATGSTALAPATAQTGNAEQTIQQATRQRVLYTANVGDARIILCRNGKALRLSYDHKGSDENEGKRIAGAGGLILNNRVNGVLAVTRALGDAYMKDLVTGHPYTTETVIQPDIDEFLILACDGLWDVCSDQEAVDLVRNTQDPQTAAKQLVEHALARFSTDNLSCMVVRFDNNKLLAAHEDKDNRIGVEGDPSTKAGGISEADAIVSDTKKNLEGGGEPLTGMSGATTHDLMDEVAQHQETGPELNPEALEAARKDTKPRQDTGRAHSPGTPVHHEASSQQQDGRQDRPGGNGQNNNSGSSYAPQGNSGNSGQNQGGFDNGSRNEPGPGSGAGMPGMPGNILNDNDHNDGPRDQNNVSGQSFNNGSNNGGGNNRGGDRR